MHTTKLISRMGLFVALAMFGLVGCKKDPCKKVSCLNGGTCVDGNCRCNLPWEGSKCEVDARDKFVGAWRGTDTCGYSRDVFTTIIKSTVSATRIVFDEYYFGMYAELTSSTNLTIPTQIVDQVTISGNGVLNGNILILNITYRHGGWSPPQTCTYTLNRQ